VLFRSCSILSHASIFGAAFIAVKILHARGHASEPRSAPLTFIICGANIMPASLAGANAHP
jgi:hypothetical protein